jgi:outer membrane protein
MCRILVLLAISVCLAGAEVRTLTLSEAVDLALKQNPDVLLARLDERKAEEAVRLARDPFIPKVVVGSGLAYSNGFPMSIEGATPSIMQARAIADVFNRPQSYRVAAAKENRRGAAIDFSAKQDEAVYRTVEMYLDAGRAARVAEATAGEVKSLEGVLETVKARVAEGRELPIEARKAELNLARARYRTEVLQSNVEATESALAGLLGMDAGDRVRPASDELPPLATPNSADAAVKSALANSKELRVLQSKLLVKGYDARAARAGRWPTLDLVAQYGLLAKFNNYDKFFNAFQRNNGQLGISLQFPVWSGPGFSAEASQAEAEVAQLGVQIRGTRRRIELDTRRAFENIQQAEMARKIARMDLDVAREQVSILLAQMNEGRASLRQVEEARSVETDKWIAFYDAGTNAVKARLNLLRQTGDLVAALH